MSILVKGVDMPKDCVACRWHARWGCEITGIVTNAAQGCPLVEIPTPHGRLIDADELLLRSVSGTEIYHISAAPTIIEAEEGADHD